MARTAKMARALNAPRFNVRRHNRCGLCGRSRAFIRYFGVCRICFRNLALKGELPGVRKASW